MRRFLLLNEKRIVIHQNADGLSIRDEPKDAKTKEAIWHEEERAWKPQAAFEDIARKIANRPVDLELSSAAVLSQKLKLPRAVLLNISQALEYGISTWTPFEASEIYAFKTVEKIEKDQVELKLSYAQKHSIDALLSEIKKTGITVDRMRLRGSSESPIVITDSKLNRLKRSCLIDASLAFAATLLGCCLAYFQISTLDKKLNDTESALRSEIASLREDENLRLAYEAWSLRRETVRKRRLREIAPSQLLISLAEHLPESITMKMLETEGDQARLELSSGSLEVFERAMVSLPLLHPKTLEVVRTSPQIQAGFRLARPAP